MSRLHLRAAKTPPASEVPRVLLVEDSERDAELALHELKRAGVICESHRVQTEAELRRSLLEFRPHIVLSDFAMPGFNGLEALGICRESDADVPFIFMSGTVGEDIAVEAVKAGANDYVMKANLTRLGPAVQRELREAARRKGMDHAVRLAEQNYRMIFENSVVGIFAVNVAGQVVSANLALARTLGFESPQAMMAGIGSVVREIYVEPGARKQFHELLLTQGVVENFETQWRRRDGSLIWVSLSARLVGDQTGGAINHIGMAEDITRRKRSEDELRRFRVALDNSADMVFIIDRATMRMVDVNDTGCRLLGYTREELLRMGPQDTMPLSRGELEKKYDELIANPSLPSGMESYYQCKDGSHLPFESTRHVLRSGDTWLIAAVSRDIRARIASEKALRESEAGLRRAQVMAKLGHVITGPRGDFESWSDTLPELVGLQPDQLPRTTRAWLDLLHPEDRPVFRGKAIEAGKTRARTKIRYRLRRADGAWIYVRQAMEPLRGEGDVGLRWFNTIQDETEQRRAEAELRDSESLKGAILESSLDCLITIDHEGRIVEFNPAAQATFGVSRDQALGKAMAELIIPPRLREAHRRGLAHYLATGEGPILGKRLELQAIRADGTEFPIELAIAPIKSGSTPLFTGFLRDITAHKQAEAKIQRLTRVYAVLSGINAAIVRIRERQELFREACRVAIESGEFRMAWIGMVDHHAQTVKPVASAGDVRDFFDTAPLAVTENKPGGHGIAGRAIRAMKPMISNDVQSDPQRLMKKELAERGINSVAIFPLIVGGEAVGVVALYAADIGFFNDEEVKLLLELAGDISFALDHIEKEEKVQYLAYYDSLTDLANRKLFDERLGQYIGTATREQYQLALVLVNIERFKSINDSFGRQAGDELLKQVAGRLLEITGDSNHVARVGADHFAIVVPHVRSEENLIRRLEEARLRIDADPFVINGNEVRISSRAGVALFPNDAKEAESLYQNAEAALKKTAPDDRIVLYTERMSERVAEKLALENKLRQALEKDEFVLHYQPKVELEDRAIIGVEALIRWQSPELGLVPPLRFIPLMEETGLILQVGAWALKRAALDHKAWVEAGLKAPRVAVNVSPIQLKQRDFVKVLEQAISEGASPAGIDLEITESLIMEDIQTNIEKLLDVRKLGVGVAIDDFGTGYSSLAYLARLPVETLKIDRSFVITMLEDPNTATLVTTMISLAHSFRLKVVAEGVDSEGQAKMLRLLRCDQMQGYLFSKPLPRDAITALLQK